MIIGHQIVSKWPKMAKFQWKTCLGHDPSRSGPDSYLDCAGKPRIMIWSWPIMAGHDFQNLFETLCRFMISHDLMKILKGCYGWALTCQGQAMTGVILGENGHVFKFWIWISNFEFEIKYLVFGAKTHLSPSIKAPLAPHSLSHLQQVFSSLVWVRVW